MNFQTCCPAEQMQYFLRTMQRAPFAAAEIAGSAEYPAIGGRVSFYETTCGVLVSALICGLPAADCACGRRIFAMHIHSGAACTGNAEDPFADTLSHYNPGGCAHPAHAGDLPPLFENGGHAFSVFLTDRFSVREVLGKTVVIHAGPDDFKTQPSGDAGRKIACGKIEKCGARRC